MQTGIETKPGKQYRVKTHNGLGKDCYGFATADKNGAITKVRISGKGAGCTIYPQWVKVIREANA